MPSSALAWFYAATLAWNPTAVDKYECKLARNPAELEEWLAPIAEAGVDIFHCSDRRFWEPAFEGDDRNLAGWTKKLVGKPTITVGSVGLNRDLMQDFVDGESLPEPQRLDELVRRYERGDFDLVAIGRVLIANHDWIKKVLQRRFGELKMKPRFLRALVAQSPSTPGQS